MTLKFNFTIYSTKESKGIDVVSIDDLQSSLLVHEEKIVQQGKKEQALKVATNPKGPDHGKGRWKDKETPQHSDRDCAINSKWEGKGRDINHLNDYKPKSVNKSNVECYRCYKCYYFKFECKTNLNRNHGMKSNLAKKKEEISLLLACHERESVHQICII